MIVATAGHIDHGKTALVKALTDVDTDRLPEEKVRGITIDIGFAYWRTRGGAVVGFVDVPGHERFVRNMLAGVCAIDFALLVVAADDGVMPQTREHLHIIDLLGIDRGVVVISKADRADSGRIGAVRQEIRELLDGSSMRQAPVMCVSALTGEGVESLRSELAQAASTLRRDTVHGRRFRYAVDRAFTAVGAGTVVTGTVFDGAVRTGDRLLLSPGGLEVRVRGIQMDGAKVERAQAGERCALNLAGVALSQVRRGDWVVHASVHAPTTQVDVEIEVLAGEAQPLRHWTPVHLHLGTRDVTSRVAMRRGASVEPGQRAFARLVLEQPIACVYGDRYILRDQAAQRTLGGGRVLDASPPRRSVRDVRMRQLTALASTSAALALKALVTATPAGVDAAWVSRNFNLDAEGFARLLNEAGLACVGTGEQALVLTHAGAQARLVRQAPPRSDENPEHVRLWQQSEPVLRRAGSQGLNVTQLAQALCAKEPVLRDMLHRRAQSGEAVRVTNERFYLRATIDDFTAVARATAQASPGGRFTAAGFRDHAGVGRALAVHILEALDRLGITQRVGDSRVLRVTSTSRPVSEGATMP